MLHSLPVSWKPQSPHSPEVALRTSHLAGTPHYSTYDKQRFHSKQLCYCNVKRCKIPAASKISLPVRLNPDDKPDNWAKRIGKWSLPDATKVEAGPGGR